LLQISFIQRYYLKLFPSLYVIIYVLLFAMDKKNKASYKKDFSHRCSHREL